MPDDHQLHLALVDVDQHGGAPLCVHQEHHGEQGHLELGAGPHEGAAHRLHQAVPAELEVEHMVVLVRLGERERGNVTALLLIVIKQCTHHSCLMPQPPQPEAV